MEVQLARKNGKRTKKKAGLAQKQLKMKEMQNRELIKKECTINKSVKQEGLLNISGLFLRAARARK